MIKNTNINSKQIQIEKEYHSIYSLEIDFFFRIAMSTIAEEVDFEASKSEFFITAKRE